MAVKVQSDLCSGCEACVDVCPESAISMDGDVALIDPEKCNDCLTCIDECPTEAIVQVD